MSTARPQTIEGIANLEALRDHGSTDWLIQQALHWQCLACGQPGD